MLAQTKPMNIILTTNNQAANLEDQDHQNSESENDVQDGNDSCSTLDSMLDEDPAIDDEEVKVLINAYFIILLHSYQQ